MNASNPSPIGHVDPLERALLTILYGIVIHFGTMWIFLEMTWLRQSFENQSSSHQVANYTIPWLPTLLICHEYWIYLQHSNVWSNPLCQRLDRQYGIALLRENQHWAIAGTLSAYWCRESLSMFLCLCCSPQRSPTWTSYAILYSLVYHTIKSYGIRLDAMRRYSPLPFGIMSTVIDKFYWHSHSEQVRSIVRWFLQGLDTFIHAAIIRDMWMDHITLSTFHTIFFVWVSHAAMNQYFRCSTATLMVETWHWMTEQRRISTRGELDPNHLVHRNTDNVAARNRNLDAKSSTTKQDYRNGAWLDDFVVRDLLRKGRVPEALKGRQGAVSRGVDSAVFMEALLTIISILYVIGFGILPFPILVQKTPLINVENFLQEITTLTLYCAFLTRLLFKLTSIIMPNPMKYETNHQRTMIRRSRFLCSTVEVILVFLHASNLQNPQSSSLRILAIVFALLVTMKLFSQTTEATTPKIFQLILDGSEGWMMLNITKLIWDDCSHSLLLVDTIVCLLWACLTIFRPLDYNSKKSSQAGSPDVVFLGHPVELSDCWALWQLPYSLQERWKRPWWSVPLWPLHFLVGYFTCHWRVKLFGDSASFFNCDDVTYGNVRIQTWTAPHFARHFILAPRQVKRNIEAAARHANHSGVKVLCLGALNKAEGINGGGMGVVRSLGPNPNVSIIHGNHLTAAAVVETAYECFGPRAKVFLTGASSKVGWAVAQALRSRYKYDILCHSSEQSRRELFISHGFKATGNMHDGTSFTNLWIVGKYDPIVATFIPQGSTAVVFAVPHPLASRKDVQVVEAGMLHMNMANLDRPRRFTNKLKNHEIYACHVAGIVAANRLKSGIGYPGNLGKHEVGPIDIETMDEWLKDARALGFCIPSVSNKRNKPNSLNSPVIIIGAGPSGLAVAGSLRRRNITCIVLEEQADPEAFGAWNSHFSGLEVTTQKRFCSLPGFPMTDCSFPHEYVTAKEYQQYLRLYADRYGIIINRGCKVIEVIQGGQKSAWQVRYSQNQGENVILDASAIVVATGKYKVPKKGINDCILSKLEEIGIPTFHSSELKDDAIWDKALHSADSGSLCIVGFGNSSSDICAKVLSSCDPDMTDTAIHLAVRTVPPVFPREYGPLRLDTVGSILRMLPGPLQEVIIKSLWRRMPFSDTVDKEFPSFLPRWNQIQGRVPVVDKFGVISTSLKTRRILAHGPICDVTVDGILFHEGINVTHPPIKINMVILATGYKADCLIAREDRVNGLFHIGLGKDKLLPIKSIGEDAEAISKEISNLFVT